MTLSSIDHAPALSGIHSQRSLTPVRVLFLHTAIDHLFAEYKVHKALAESSMAYGVDSYFLWQRGARRTGDNEMRFTHPERVRYIDYGRDLSTNLRPSGAERRLWQLANFLPSLIASAASIREIKPALLYTSQQVRDISLGTLLSRLFRLPHVVHLHYTVGPWLGAGALRTIRRCPNLIAISEFIRQSAQLQGVATSALRVVPNAVIPAAPGPVDRVAMRAEFGWASDTPVLISAGRLDPIKGHHHLIEVFARVLARMPEARLLICGRTLNDSSYPDQLQRRVAELGIQHAVVFAGHRYDIEALMCASDVFTLLSELEPFGLVFLEAMSLGLPVVAPYSGAVPEIVVHGVTGLLAAPDQPDVIAEHMLRLLADRELAAQMGAAGRQHAAETFAIESIVQKWAALVRSYVGQPPVANKP